jgi:hypothetical protein
VFYAGPQSDVFNTGKRQKCNAKHFPVLKTFAYSDKAEDATDEIEILFEDSGDLWKNEWYPAKGDKMNSTISTIEGTLDGKKRESSDFKSMSLSRRFRP